MTTCSVAVAALQSWSSGDVNGGGAGFSSPYSKAVTLTPVDYPAVVDVLFAGINTYEGGTASLAVAAPYSSQAVRNGQSPSAAAYRALASGAPGNLGLTYTGRFFHYAHLAIVIPTTASAPVQTKQQTTAGAALVADSAPTEGNLLVVKRTVLSFGSGLPGPPAGWTQVLVQLIDDGGVSKVKADIIVRCAGAGESTTIVSGGSGQVETTYFSEWEVVIPPHIPVADFSADPTSGAAPLAVDFADLSTNSPTSWAWDFGDSGTSTAQHPSHTYTVPGTYTVSLTATNAEGSDTETKTAYIGVAVDVDYEPPRPAGAIVEIYAADPGAARWDLVNWDEAVWSGARWQDITPESIDVLIRWGSSEPERGILSRPDAGTWAITHYDPDRRLDPSNVDGPFYGDLEPGLPIRVNHRGITVRQGVAESIGHSFLDGVTRNGYIRVTDNLSRLANAAVPPDVSLPNTLYARARTVISTAGLNVTVLPDPPSGDPALVTWVTDVNEWSAWQWIQDAAEQVLHIPYIDNIGRLGFRPWAVPLYRGRELAAPELIDLQVITDYKGLYSVVQGTDTDGITIVERALTPTPKYGTRTYLRSDPTPDVGDWAQAVLEDRGIGGLRWVPGQVYPLTAESVERLATIEAVELVNVSDDTQDPIVAVDAIIVGGEIQITSKREAAAEWRFTFEAAQVPELPLVVSGSDPPEFLLRTGGGEYLYPS